MLFKQWNEIAEPRHHLDSPLAVGIDDESLQKGSLPLVELPNINWNKFHKIFLTTGIMDPLFPKELLGVMKLGDIRTTLTIDRNQQHENGEYSWNFEENFPNEVNLNGGQDNDDGQSLTFVTTVEAFGDCLLVGVKENFLKVSPIIYNRIAQVLLSVFDGTHHELKVLGTSDRITELKSISHLRSDLQPPEFVTGFIGSILTQLTVKNIPFEGFIAPSEGAIGFEKMSMNTMPELIDICGQWINGNSEKYRSECYRHWRLDSGAVGSLSGLYV
ncbi:hypothetical protein ZYGR_0U01370 [Zygosaccharomyces rouxii]|uniref:ZYRO0F11770p n=2 Tax=Zygosaccharomyces rouxii TaxID=4956 RepID=C5DYB7_ZYGRC|nr:uncharacterized protein ZYRO0F11770g [Zygosaccharomyces rouxii]KAH9199537.1 proteasome chaperone 1 [Zygosaccharomyces rouxii]GAV50281.1 hypothetical protein ZYGR_0U01370 [Zygosaccharomyces rouxii]CAR28778.1 ZYRO0F11770p [Zygosaccharomyces rouxii]